MRFRVTFLSINLFLISILYGQEYKGGIIRGTVVDAQTNAPIEFANVSLHNPKDSTVVKGNVSGKNGEFIISGIPEGSFYLKTGIIGYEKKIIPNINVVKEKSETNLGIIKLSQSAVLMKESQVIGQKPSEEYHLDKKVINVSQNLTAASGTALDVLQHQPSIQVDANGNVTLRGSSNFTVLINGKPNVLQGSDALRQIPANIIDNIELITNPSAKYDAEGSAGIININTKKTNESFISGIANGGVGTKDKRNGDFTFNYREDPYSVSAGLDYRKYSTSITQDIDRETFFSTGSINNFTALNQKAVRDNYSFRFGIDYNLSSLSSISLNASYGMIDISAVLNSRINNFSNNLNSYSFTNSDNNFDVKYFNSTFFYSQKFIPNVNELTFEATYINVKLPTSQKTNEFITNSTYLDRLPNPKMRDFEDNTKRNEVRLKTNYSHKFNPKSTLEAGLQSNLFYRNLDLKNQVFDWITSTWVTTADLTNQFDFRNNIYSAFVTYSNNFYDFDFQVGLRTELTDRLLEQKTLTQRYEYNKAHVFPSLNVSRKLGNDQTFQFSYSKRINRPNERFLNPYPNYSDSYLVSKGNPNLLPELTDSYELNYQKVFQGFFLSIQTYLRKSNNALSQNFWIDEQGRMVTTFMNFANTTTAGAEISGNLTPISWLRLDPAINLYNYSMDGYVMNIKTNTSNFSLTSRLTSTFLFSANTRMQITANYIGKQIGPQIEVKPFFILSGNIRQEFFEKKLALTLQVQNLFNTVKYNVTANGDNFKSAILIRPEQSIINLAITYNFNNFKRSTRQQQNIDININEGF